MSYDAFIRASRKGLACLVRDWGFVERTSSSALEASVSFTRPDAFVCILTERGSDPWMTVNLGRKSFGVHKALEKLDPDYARRLPSGESAVVAYYVEAFRAHASQILNGLPRKPPAPAPPRKPRATRAGALDFLVNELGWASASMREFATKETTLIFHRDPVRITVTLAEGKRLTHVRISAGRKEVDLDDAIATLAPELGAHPSEQKARLAFYAEFFRTRGQALLTGKRSAWSRM